MFTCSMSVENLSTTSSRFKFLQPEALSATNPRRAPWLLIVLYIGILMLTPTPTLTISELEACSPSLHISRACIFPLCDEEPCSICCLLVLSTS